MFAGVCQQADKTALFARQKVLPVVLKSPALAGLFFVWHRFCKGLKKEKGNTKRLGKAPELYGDKVRLFLDLGRKVSIIKIRMILNSGDGFLSKYTKKILEIVQASRDHMTAEQIFGTLRQTYPSVVRATVYNNLNRLCEEGKIRKISLEGMPERYDRIQRHDHLVCRKCGRLSDLDLGDMTRQLERKAGISILSYDLKLLYLCEECRNKSEQKG